MGLLCGGTVGLWSAWRGHIVWSSLLIVLWGEETAIGRAGGGARGDPGPRTPVPEPRPPARAACGVCAARARHMLMGRPSPLPSVQ